jgi:hypothetical protein
MTMINVNPLIEPGALEAGDRAMMAEMQARTGTIQPTIDPAAFQQPTIDPGLFKLVAPTEQPTLEPSTSAFRRRPASRAEQIAMARGAVPSGEDTTYQPKEPITKEGAVVMAPMPKHPVTGMAKSTAPITKYVPETGLDPAQPGGPVSPSPSKPPTEYDPSVGPIDTKGSPPAGPIGTKDAYKSTGSIPAGSPTKGPIAQQYQQQQQKKAAAVAATKKTSPVVPIAVAAGAALLLSRLL